MKRLKLVFKHVVTDVRTYFLAVLGSGSEMNSCEDAGILHLRNGC